MIKIVPEKYAANVCLFCVIFEIFGISQYFGTKKQPPRPRFTRCGSIVEGMGKANVHPNFGVADFVQGWNQIKVGGLCPEVDKSVTFLDEVNFRTN